MNFWVNLITTMKDGPKNFMTSEDLSLKKYTYFGIFCNPFPI
jgi:hypothetical protein